MNDMTTTQKNTHTMIKPAILFITALMAATVRVAAEDGHRLWLRCQPVNKAKINATVSSPTVSIAKQELE